MKLADDTPAEEHIGGRDLTRWPTPVGRGLVRVVAVLAANISAHSVLYITASVGLALVIGLTAAGAGIYDAVVEHDGISGLDQPALNQSIAYRTSINTQLLTAFTHLGGPIGMTIIASVITVALVWRWRSRTPLILMLIAVAGSLTMTSVGKAIVGRVRPPLTEAVPPYEYAFSFPSGHALNNTVIAGMVAYLLVRRRTMGASRRRDRGHYLGVGHGPEPGVPGPPLAHRRDLRLAARRRLAGPGDYLPPALPHYPAR